MYQPAALFCIFSEADNQSIIYLADMEPDRHTNTNLYGFYAY